MEPGAYEAEAKATAEAEAKNEQAFEDFAGEKQEEGLTDTVDYQNFIEVYHLRERMSPRMKLAEQIHGYGLVSTTTTSASTKSTPLRCSICTSVNKLLPTSI